MQRFWGVKRSFLIKTCNSISEITYNLINYVGLCQLSQTICKARRLEDTHPNNMAIEFEVQLPFKKVDLS